MGFLKYLKRIIKKDKGVTAIEFAMIAPIFFFLMFAIMEVMLIFFVNTILEESVAEEARLVRTGQAQSGTSPISQSDFKQAICDKMFGMVDCDTRLFVMVQNFGSTVPSGALATPWDDGVLTIGSSTDEPYETSAAGDFVIVRAYYLWPLITPGLTSALSDYGDSTYGSYNKILVATSAFRNEPFN